MKLSLSTAPAQGILAGCLLLVALGAGPAAAGSPPDTTAVNVPLKLDYPLLRKMLVSQLFTGPGDSHDLFNDADGCNRLELHDPRISPQDGALRIVSDLDTQIGMRMLGHCRTVFTWQGSAGFTGTPELAADGRSVRIQPEETWLERDGSRYSSSRLPDDIHARLKDWFSRYTVDLSPYTESLSTLLPAMLPRHQAAEIDSLMQSLHFSDLAITSDGLRATLGFEVTPVDPVPDTPVAALGEAELAEWESRWQAMDQLLVVAIKHYADATSQQSMRDVLLETLVESRYRLRDALASPQAPGDDDLVRAWFLESWQRLAPAVRAIALEQPGQQHLLWLSLISATDALRALDELGPAVGLDISTNGLRRLARLVGTGEIDLHYDFGVDPMLQELFESHLGKGSASPLTLHLDFSLFSRARAATPGEKLNSWAPGREDLADYLPLVARLLNDAAGGVLRDRSLDTRYARVFMQMVWATAWQESCWRQYTVEDRRPVPLRSNTGDVGLMQINERVWRGFFDQQKLRWDFDYNAEAGARILLDYLVKYALPKGEHKQPGGLPNLARASYSAYNGGPSQVARYRRPDPAPYHRKVDTAFWNKYRQIESGTAQGVSQCLGGDVPLPVRLPDTAAKAGNNGTAGDLAQGTAWLKAQPGDSYTLQLGAFSTAASARESIDRPEIPDSAHVYFFSDGDKSHYLVLYGSYKERSTAEAAGGKLKGTQPWVRQFRALR